MMPEQEMKTAGAIQVDDSKTLEGYSAMKGMRQMIYPCAPHLRPLLL